MSPGRTRQEEDRKPTEDVNDKEETDETCWQTYTVNIKCLGPFNIHIPGRPSTYKTGEL